MSTAYGKERHRPEEQFYQGDPEQNEKQVYVRVTTTLAPTTTSHAVIRATTGPVDSSSGLNNLNVYLICLTVSVVVVMGGIIVWLLLRSKRNAENERRSAQLEASAPAHYDTIKFCGPLRPPELYERPILCTSETRVVVRRMPCTSEILERLGPAPCVPAEYDDVGPPEPQSGIYEEVRPPPNKSALYLKILPTT